VHELKQMATDVALDWLQTLDDSLEQYPPSIMDMLAVEEAQVVPNSFQRWTFGRSTGRKSDRHA